MRTRSLVIVAVIGCFHPVRPHPPRSDRVALGIDTGEADAVLAMVDAPSDAAWQRLIATAGYHQLQVRERAMHRAFDDATLRAFVGSAARAPALRATLARWSATDLDEVSGQVLAYLPREAKLAATVYPVIKPSSNSFVNFDDAGAAIFVFVDPDRTPQQFDNTVAHELHHIGFASLPAAPCDAAPEICLARTWPGSFGEGFAMLAAAGGPEIDPHRYSGAADRERWHRDVGRFDDDLARVEALLRDIVAGRLAGDAATEQAMTLFGVQGPWYTVGWVMAVSVERCFGRPALIDGCGGRGRSSAATTRRACAARVVRVRRRRAGTPIWSARWVVRPRRAHPPGGAQYV